MLNARKKMAEEENIADATSFFAKGFKFIGDIDANSDIRIEGIIEGNIKTSKKVIIGPSGSIIGNVHATNISLMGEVSGGIVISGMASISETAKIYGSIEANKIQIDPGAIIEASIRRLVTSNNGNNGMDNTVKKGIQVEEERAKGPKSYQMAKAL